ncbi:MAG: hypothetical protein JW776_13660 [Candidatus Lokiarchaeota archaeon]|nr:hypothetical protein [Candidatus Lokiarchaeota archaeon]
MYNAGGNYETAKNVRVNMTYYQIIEKDGKNYQKDIEKTKKIMFKARKSWSSR